MSSLGGRPKRAWPLSDEHHQSTDEEQVVYDGVHMHEQSEHKQMVVTSNEQMAQESLQVGEDIMIYGANDLGANYD